MKPETTETEIDTSLISDMLKKIASGEPLDEDQDDTWENGREAREKIQAEERNAKRLLDLKLRIEESIPPLFARTSITHPGFRLTAWDRVKDHRMSEENPWVGFVGVTGRCKTRIAYLYATEEILRVSQEGGNASFEFIASYQIDDAVRRQFSDDPTIKKSARYFLDRLRTVDVLFIDDLGKGRPTPAVAAEMWALIDHRHSHIMRTIWTSNSTPEAIAGGMSEDMAGAFAGRINESSKIFTFRN
jgi:hypothetical protein